MQASWTFVVMLLLLLILLMLPFLLCSVHLHPPPHASPSSASPPTGAPDLPPLPLHNPPPPPPPSPFLFPPQLPSPFPPFTSSPPNFFTASPSGTSLPLHRSRYRLPHTSPWLHDAQAPPLFASVFRLSRASLDARFYNASRLIIVDQSGFGHFRTIQAAVNAIPINNTHIYTIFVADGLFEEKVVFPHNKPFIRLQGLGSEHTIISWNDTAATFSSNSPEANSRSPDSNRPLGTFHSATVAINAPNFIARGVTFQNTAPAPDGGAAGGQAVALQVSGDQVAFYDCKFRGKQDTLYDHKGRHYFRKCYIEGSIDFIFGDGLSLYKGCVVYSVGSGFITAQKRQNASDDSGFSFVNCNITGVEQGINVYLGRAWGAFSRVIYASCYMDAVIVPDGWHNWGDPSKEATVYYSEFNCTGPGAESAGRVSWSHQLNQSQAVPFMDISFVQGDEWLPYQ